MTSQGPSAFGLNFGARTNGLGRKRVENGSAGYRCCRAVALSLSSAAVWVELWAAGGVWTAHLVSSRVVRGALLCCEIPHAPLMKRSR